MKASLILLSIAGAVIVPHPIAGAFIAAALYAAMTGATATGAGFGLFNR